MKSITQEIDIERETDKILGQPGKEKNERIINDNSNNELQIIIRNV